jgi:hypothetical protein
MRMTASLAPLALAASLALIGAAPPSPLWLDRPVPANWNAPAPIIPQAPAWSGDGKKIAGRKDPELVPGGRCSSVIRAPKGLADRRVAAMGWSIFSPTSSGYLIPGGPHWTIVMGTSDADGMCRPVAYQVFAFRDGRYVGTLSPSLMTSRSDGSFVTAKTTTTGLLRVDFARYVDADAMCCPHATTRVTFGLRTIRGRSAIVPIATTTFKNP